MSGSGDLFDFARKVRYPDKPGHKTGGTSEIAADEMDDIDFQSNQPLT